MSHSHTRLRALRVAVFAGGPSGEHPISLQSAHSATEALREQPVELVQVRVGRDLRWAFDVPPLHDVDDAAWMPAGAGLAELGARQVDAALITIHGPFGEDGTLQGALEVLGVSYVGSGVLSSAVAMHKAVARDVLTAAGVPMPKGASLRRNELGSAQTTSLPDFPVFVKPAEGGSSIGAGPADDRDALRAQLDVAFALADEVMVEERLQGTELTVAIVEDPDTGAPEALPVVEIRPVGHAFFDLESKYTPGHNEELCPAPIDAALASEVQAIALAAHRALRCRHLSRVDFLVVDGRPHVLEVNTLPGLTAESLIKKAAGAVGWTYSELLMRLLRAAIR